MNFVFDSEKHSKILKFRQFSTENLGGSVSVMMEISPTSGLMNIHTVPTFMLRDTERYSAQYGSKYLMQLW